MMKLLGNRNSTTTPYICIDRHRLKKEQQYNKVYIIVLTVPFSPHCAN